MFCPSCGRDDSHKHKFCPSCGTNLEAVSQALFEDTEGQFTKVERSVDRFIARYAEHVFKDAPDKALDRRVGKSWQILGQGALTTLFDIALFCIMVVLLPIRFLALLIRTPIGLLSERSRNRKSEIAELESKDVSYLPTAQPELLKPVPSVTEHTTVSLREKR